MQRLYLAAVWERDTVCTWIHRNYFGVRKSCVNDGVYVFMFVFLRLLTIVCV